MVIADIQREDVRNQLLRRADWRFLLPNPNPRKSICFADGLLADAIVAISGSTAHARHGLSTDCDLAVAVNPDSTTLRAAWAALQPGGACYTEWYSPLVGGPQGVRRRLEVSGFTDVRCYWPWPWLDHAPAAFWLPLSSPGALEYFRSSRPKATAIGQRTLDTVRWILWRTALSTRLITPVCAIARKPASTTINDLPLPVLDQIRAYWKEWGFGPRPNHLSWLLLTGGQRSINKVVGLVFAGSERDPRLIVKMPRVPASIPALADEAATLDTLHATRLGGVPGAPRKLFCLDFAGLPVLGETVLTGLPLWTLLRRDNYRELALKATDWLVGLLQDEAPLPRSAWWGRLVEPVLHDFERSFGPVVDEGLIEETWLLLAGLDNLPLVCEQRDFSPWNVLVSPNGEIVVLDWESAELRGLPALDLIYFLTYTAFFLEGTLDSHRFRDTYRRALNPETFTGRVLNDCQARYASKMGLDLAVLPALRLLVWLIHARSEYQHMMADTAGVPEPNLLRRSLFVALWEEELHDAN